MKSIQIEEYAKYIDENQFHNRILFSSVEYDSLENMNIQSFKAYLEEKSVVLPEQYCNKSDFYITF